MTHSFLPLDVREEGFRRRKRSIQSAGFLSQAALGLGEMRTQLEATQMEMQSTSPLFKHKALLEQRTQNIKNQDSKKTEKPTNQQVQKKP